MRRRIIWGVTATVLLVALVVGYGRVLPRVPCCADDVPAVTVGAPGALLAPAQPPAGLFVADVRQENSGGSRDRVAVYGRPGNADPLAGPVLVALYLEGSDARSWPPRLTGARSAWVNGHPATVGRAGDHTWVVWSVWFDSDQERDQLAVAGARLADDEVLDAARHLATGDDRMPRITGGLPDGMGPVAGGRTNADGAVLPGGRTEIEWSDRQRDASLTLTTWTAGERAGLVARALAGANVFHLNGRTGSAGPGPYTGVRRWAWTENGLVLTIEARNLPDADVERFITDLRPLDPAGLEALRQGWRDYPPDRMLRAGTRFVSGGRLDAVTWSVGLRDGRRPGEYEVGYALRTAERLTDGEVTFIPAGRDVWASWIADGYVIGSARGDGVQIRIGAVIVTTGPPAEPDGRRWFLASVPAARQGSSLVTAHTADGTEFARQNL